MAVSRHISASKTAFYSFSGSKQAPIKRLLGPSTRLGTLYKELKPQGAAGRAQAFPAAPAHRKKPSGMLPARFLPFGLILQIHLSDRELRRRNTVGRTADIVKPGIHTECNILGLRSMFTAETAA